MDSAAICGAVESLRQEVESTGWLLDKVHWRQGWRRRNVLLLTIAGFLVFNSITAFSSNYWLTLAARFFASVSAGLAWSLLAGYARRMVPVHRQGKALAVAMVGTPIALSLGVPLHMARHRCRLAQRICRQVGADLGADRVGTRQRAGLSGAGRP
ncbi:MFS transporter [Cupriavidus plantarum]|uniref:MFS transporter n=1 Tax=Cupriavidus plantarum TaxID=942865 RepID=UPI001851E59A|nr:MFS transporter [Cupriavidus plantarum]NYI00130.1 hypothetical protein [Cupriavidus plantarum]